MNVINHTLNIGVEKPFILLHASDTHLTLADERADIGGVKLDLAQKRIPAFEEFDPLESLEALEKLSKELNAPILHTGDLIDFFSYANLDRAEKFMQENDVFIVSGNHEYGILRGSPDETPEYRNLSLPELSKRYSNNIRMDSRIINGVNIVAIDNSYYQIEETQIEFLRSELERELPTIIMMHIPIYTDEIFSHFALEMGFRHIKVICLPEDKLQNHADNDPDYYRANALTCSAVELITSSPNVKMLLTGHIHHNFSTSVNGIPQYLTGRGTIRVFNIQ